MIKHNSSSFSSKVLQDGLTFDDLLLLPDYSEILPHEANISSLLTDKILLETPLISAAMDTVTDSSMAIQMSVLGGIGVIHKNFTPAEQAAEVKIVRENLGNKAFIAAAVGVTQIDFEQRIPALVDSSVNVLVVDTAHGHSASVISTIEKIKNKYQDSFQLIVGNIATGEAARALANAGADCVKVGIGPGSICTTRIIAGIGVPQVTAIMNVADALKNTKVKIIADGGIKFSGDIVKALSAGAHTVMIGSLLAGTEESPGELITFQGRVYKKYRGMGSLGAMRSGSKDRYFQAKQNDHSKLVPEGIEGQVPYKGSVKDVIHQLIGGLKAGMGYTGCRTIHELHEKAKFVKITSAGLKESHVHDVFITEESPNYTLSKY